jgi:putative peptidoglycan lipid II flippase
MNRTGTAMASSFIPQFKQSLIRESEVNAWEVASSIINLFVLCFLGLSVFMYFTSASIIKVIAPGFEAERLSLSVNLFIFFTPFLFLTAFCNLLGVVSYSYNDFFIPALGANFSKVGAIVGLIYLTGRFGISGIVIGITAGALLCLLLQLERLKEFRDLYKPTINFNTKEVKNILGQFMLLLIATSLTQINLTIDQIFASYLGNGKLSALSYATRFLNIVTVLFPGAIVMATFPALSEKMAQKKHEEFKRLIQRNISICSFVLIPLIILLIFLAKDLTALLLLRGNFTAQDTTQVVNAIRCYAPGMFFCVMISILTPAFHITYRTKTIVKVGLFICFLNCGLNYVLIKAFDYLGIAISTSICTFLIALLLSLMLDRSGLKIEWHRIAFSFKKTLLAASAMLILVLAANSLISNFSDKILKITFFMVLGNVTYLLLNYFSKSEELKVIYLNLKGVFTRA